MKNSIFSPNKFKLLKSKAKRLKKQDAIPYTLALDIIAKNHGYSHWKDFITSASQSRPKTAQTCAFMSLKGGTGKTTLLAHIITCIAQQSQAINLPRILLIDTTDILENSLSEILRLGFNIKKTQKQSNTYTTMTMSYAPSGFKFDFVALHNDIFQHHDDNHSVDIALADFVSEVSSVYDLILFDTPSGLNSVSGSILKLPLDNIYVPLSGENTSDYQTQALLSRIVNYTLKAPTKPDVTFLLRDNEVSFHEIERAICPFNPELSVVINRLPLVPEHLKPEQYNDFYHQHARGFVYSLLPT